MQEFVFLIKKCFDKSIVILISILEKDRQSKTDTVKKNDELMPQKIQILGEILHDGEVNRLRHNPH